MIRQRLKAVVGCFHVRFCVLASSIKPERSHRVKGTAKLLNSTAQSIDGVANVASCLCLQPLVEHFGTVDPRARQILLQNFRPIGHKYFCRHPGIFFANLPLIPKTVPVTAQECSSQHPPAAAHLRDRLDLLKQHLSKDDHLKVTRERFERFFERLEPIRELRNHIAHGTIRMALSDDLKTWEITLSLPRELDGSNSPEARHVTFNELDKAREELGKLMEEFEELDGKWIVDADIRL